MDFFKELGKAYDTGDEAAEKYLLEAYRSPRAAEEREFRVVVCNELGSLYRAAGRYPESYAFFTEAMEQAALCFGADSLKYGTILMNRAGTSRMSGDVEKAIPDFETALGIVSKKENCGPVIASTWNNLGLAYLAAGRLDEAESALVRGVEIASQVGKTFMVGTGLINLASVCVKLGRNEDALKYAERAELFFAGEPNSPNGKYAREMAAMLRTARNNPTAKGPRTIPS